MILSLWYKNKCKSGEKGTRSTRWSAKGVKEEEEETHQPEFLGVKRCNTHKVGLSRTVALLALSLTFPLDHFFFFLRRAIESATAHTLLS